jgi:hypothetical protein
VIIWGFSSCAIVCFSIRNLQCLLNWQLISTRFSNILLFYLKTPGRGKLFGQFKEQAQEDAASFQTEAETERQAKKSFAEDGDPAGGYAGLTGLSAPFGQQLMACFLDRRVEVLKPDDVPKVAD